MGFNRVFLNFIELETVLNMLDRDLDGTEAVADYPVLWEQSLPARSSFAGAASDTLLDIETFETSRREVLEQWKTGSGARGLAGNAQFLLRQPSFPRIEAQTRMGQGQMLVQPRCGVA